MHVSMCRSGYSCHPASRNSCFGCARLIRLLDELVNPRLEHLAELLVEGIAEGAAGAGGSWAPARRRSRWRRWAGPAVWRAAYCLRPRGFPGAPRRWCGRCSCSEAAPDERCGCARPARSWPRISPATFRSCPRSVELDFSSSRFTRVPPEGLAGSAASSLPLSRLQRLLSLGLLPIWTRTRAVDCCCCWKIGRKKNASAGPGLPTVAARVAAKTTAAPWVARMRMWKLHCRHERIGNRVTRAAARLCDARSQHRGRDPRGSVGSRQQRLAAGISDFGGP